MPQWTTQFEWSFPLGIPGVVIALLLSAALAAVSYRFTLRAMSRKPRVLLALLRFVFFTALIFCLCRPMITKKQTIRNERKRNIAVLIDESSSMGYDTLSGSTRFEKARSFWERNLKPHSDKYNFQLYQFGQEVHPVEDFKLPNPPVFTSTHLYGDIAEWNDRFPAEGIDGVICMTDGIDTSDAATADEAISALRNTPLPHVFVPITTAASGPPFAAFRKLEVEPVAKLNTKTPVTLVTATSGMDSKKPMTLTVLEDQTEIDHADLPSTADGITTRTHTFDLLIDRRGTHHYTAQIKVGDKVLAQKEWSVMGAQNDYLKVLLYQGGLDWGTRYLRGVFDRDNRSDLEVEFAPGSFPALMDSEKNETEFPSIDTLSAYDVVIILKMRQEQIADQMEATLREFVSSGGSLLFIIANTLDAQAYIGSPLETFLPVEFESIASTDQYDAKTAKFLKTMNAYRQSSSSIRTISSDGTVETRLRAPQLYPFDLTEEGRRSPIFSYLTDSSSAIRPQIPEFQDFALVRKCKPGARVLAVHPELAAQGEQRILLAQQAFGEGQVAVLATDPLWRWKLSNRSFDPSYDEFWKGFMAWLGAGRIHATYWDVPSKSVVPENPVECTLNVSARAQVPPAMLRATLTDEASNTTAPLKLAHPGLENTYTATITPAAGHSYALRAYNGTDLLAESFLSCPVAAGHKELQELKPDLETLRRLAGSSIKHELVQTGQTRDWDHWLPEQLDENDLVKTEANLWHKPWIFLFMLSLFLGELIIRRKYKLV